VTAVTSTPVPAATRWHIDKVHSSVGFAVKHMVVSTYRGQFDDYDATLTANEDGSLRLEGSVKPGSVVVKDENLAGHLASPDFFDVANYPEIRFNSTLVRVDGGELIVDGELTIKGHTRPIEAHGTITEPVVALGDVVKLGIKLEASIDRTEYGLNWNAPLPKGGFALANDVQLIAELQFAQE
jgi:polyisoprenoid-binding protein YceI